jgi:hypothetical protein
VKRGSPREGRSERGVIFDLEGKAVFWPLRLSWVEIEDRSLSLPPIGLE